MEEKQINWVNYTEIKPALSGYYMTRYFNPQVNEVLYKALWYSAEQEMFQGHWPWAWEYDKEWTDDEGRSFKTIKYHPLDVREFVPESRADYYTACGV